MKPIRNLTVASSLLFTCLGSTAVARAASDVTLGARGALVSVAGTSHDRAARPAAPLSSALLALGSTGDSRPAAAPGDEDTNLARREQASPELRNFHGGRVYLYMGGGATLILVLILLIILL